MSNVDLNKVTFDWLEFDELVIELGHIKDFLSVISVGVADSSQAQARAITGIECLLGNVITEMKSKQAKNKKERMIHTPYELTAFNARGGVESVSYYQTYAQANEKMRLLQRLDESEIVEVRINRIDGKGLRGEE